MNKYKCKYSLLLDKVLRLTARNIETSASVQVHILEGC